MATLPGSLTGSYEDRQETPVDQLLQRVVAPHVVPAKDPRQDVLIAAVDSAIAETMRRVLHHPDFQTTEALWRSVDLLIRRLETGVNLQIVLYDITAEELAADLSATETLEETGLYKLLVEQPALDARQGAISAIVGNYLFEHTPPHAELLGRMGKIAAAAKAPFIAAISAACLQKSQDRDLHALIVDSWSALSKLPEAAYLGLTVPRFLLRNPYGQKTDPIDRFEFEEFTPQYGLRGMLWGNSAILAGLLLGQTCARQGLKKMNIGSILSVNEMPYYYFTDRDGDQVALPCTERLLDVRTAAQVSAQGWIPALSIRGRAEVRLGGLLSLAGPALSGPWPAPAGAQTTDRPKPAPAEEPPAESEEGTAESVWIWIRGRFRTIWTWVRPPTTRPRRRLPTRATAIWMPCWRVWAAATRRRQAKHRAARKWTRNWRRCWRVCEVVRASKKTTTRQMARQDRITKTRKCRTRLVINGWLYMGKTKAKADLIYNRPFITSSCIFRL